MQRFAHQTETGDVSRRGSKTMTYTHVIVCDEERILTDERGFYRLNQDSRPGDGGSAYLTEKTGRRIVKRWSTSQKRALAAVREFRRLNPVVEAVNGGKRTGVRHA